MMRRPRRLPLSLLGAALLLGGCADPGDARTTGTPTGNGSGPASSDGGVEDPAPATFDGRNPTGADADADMLGESTEATVLCALDETGVPTCTDGCRFSRVCRAGTSDGCEERQRALLPGGSCLAFAASAGGTGCATVRGASELPEGIERFGSPAPSFEDDGLQLGGSARSFGGLLADRPVTATHTSTELLVKLQLPASCPDPCLDGLLFGWVEAGWRPSAEETEPPFRFAVAVSSARSEARLIMDARVVGEQSLPRNESVDVKLTLDPFTGVALCVEDDCRTTVTLPPPRGPLIPVLVGRALQGGERIRVLSWSATGGRCDRPSLLDLPGEPLRLRAAGERSPWEGAPPDLRAPTMLALPGAARVLLAFEAWREEGPRVHVAERRADGAFELWRDEAGSPLAWPGRAPRLFLAPEGTPRLLFVPGDAPNDFGAVSLDHGRRSADGELMEMPLDTLPGLPEASSPEADPAPAPSVGRTASDASDAGGTPEGPWLLAPVGLPSGALLLLARDASGGWRLGLREPPNAAWLPLAESWLSLRLRELSARGPIEDVALQQVGGAWSLLVTVRRGARRRVHQLLSHDLVGWQDMGLVLRADGSAPERIDVGRPSEVLLEDGVRLVVYEAFDGTRHTLRQRRTPFPGGRP